MNEDFLTGRKLFDNFLTAQNLGGICSPFATTSLVVDDISRPVSRVDQVDLGLLSRVKLVYSSVTVEIFWHRRFHYKSFQVDLTRNLAPNNFYQIRLSMSSGE